MKNMIVLIIRIVNGRYFFMDIGLFLRIVFIVVGELGGNNLLIG